METWKRWCVPLIVLGLAACSSSDSDGGGGGADVTASGVVVKGPVNGATVTVYELLPTGTLGDVLGTGTTSATGEFDVVVPADQPGWGVAKVSGGTFVDEATGATVPIPADQPLFGFVDMQTTAVRYAVTPLTTIAFALMQTYAHDPELTLDDCIENAYTATENYFGVADIDLQQPADLTAGVVGAGPTADQGAILAGLSELADAEAVPVTELVTALAADARDGTLDGKTFLVDVALGAGTLAPTAGTVDLAAAVSAFLASLENASGLTDADTLVDDELLASTGEFDWPIQIRGLVNGYGDTNEVVTADLEAASVPASPQILIETTVLSITRHMATELRFEIPSGLALGKHDLVVRDLDTGLVSRLRDAIEVFDDTARPTITEISPPAGPLTGGTFLQLHGTNFGPDTEVEVDGVLAERLAQDFPGWMVVATPPNSEGIVNVTVRNGTSETTVASGFEYRSSDTRVNPSLPDPTETLVFGGFRNFVDAGDGLTAQAFVGRSTFTNDDTGNFTLTDFTATEVAPTIATRSRGGQTFQSNESLAKAFLLSDATNGIEDFVRGSTNEENGVSLGTTAFGPACFFPEPIDVAPALLSGTFWINGIEADIGQSTVRQKTGWVEFDETDGSANLLAHGRDYDGAAAADLGAETWDLSYSVDSTLKFQGTRTTGGSTEPLIGHFSSGFDFGFLILNGSTGTLGFYQLIQVEHGVESAAWGGWVGGAWSHVIADDGLGGSESAFESGSFRGLIGRSLDSAELAFRRVTRVTPSDLVGTFAEKVGAAEIVVSPSGRLFRYGHLAGYVNAYGGLRLDTGDFPDECDFYGAVDREVAVGGAVYRHSRKSYLSLDQPVRQISIQARFEESGAIHRQELGTDMADLTLDTQRPPSIDGVPFYLAGTIPELEDTVLPGIHKSTVRDGTGAVTTTRGAPTPWQIRVSYSFIDDVLDLVGTAQIQAGGPFDGATFPRWIASGTTTNDGQVTTLRGNDEFLGDGLIFFLANFGKPILEPDYDMNSVGLAYEPNEGGLSGVSSRRTDLTFVGNGTVTSTSISHTQDENNAFTPGAVAGLGLNTAPAGQEIRLNIPNGADADREWVTFWTPTADAFVGIDDTPTLDTVELVLGVRPALAGGSFIDDDRTLILLELDAATSRATTQSLQLKPRVGSLLSGELFTSHRTTGFQVEPAQLFVGTAPTNIAPGRARVPIVGQIPVLDFFFSSSDQAIGQEDLTLSITPRIIRSDDL